MNTIINIITMIAGILFIAAWTIMTMHEIGFIK